MYVLVLTGGMGAGKTTAAEYFRGRGAAVVYLDDIARGALAPGSAALTSVVEAFGPAVLAADGSLDRGALARVAFADADSAARLNAIVHPEVAREVGPALDQLRLLPSQPEVVVLEVPLLVEAPVYRELADHVLAISAPEELRVARAAAGHGVGVDEVRRRIRVQAADEERAALADTVIANDGTVDEFLVRLAAFWDAEVAPDVG